MVQQQSWQGSLRRLSVSATCAHLQLLQQIQACHMLATSISIYAQQLNRMPTGDVYPAAGAMPARATAALHHVAGDMGCHARSLGLHHMNLRLLPTSIAPALKPPPPFTPLQQRQAGLQAMT
jgi:hypothetical protein